MGSFRRTFRLTQGTFRTSKQGFHISFILETIVPNGVSYSGQSSVLHAIDLKSVTFSRQPDQVTFRLLPEFSAMNQRSSLGPLGQRCYTVPALASTLDRDLPDRLLWPVRALR